MEFSDEALAVVVPIVVYWVYSAMYLAVPQSMDKYRLHSRREEDRKNFVSKRDVIKGVLSQQLVQAVFVAVVLAVRNICLHVSFYLGSDPRRSAGSRTDHGRQKLDAGSHFHDAKLIVLHGFGMAVRGGNVRAGWVAVHVGTGSCTRTGLLMDTLGGLLAFVLSGMSPRTSIYFFSFCTVKAIDDHCGLMLPWNLFHRFFWNNTAYHDLHHQMRGGLYNFSQPFFVMWDKIFGTHMPYLIP
ncbi:hypothetical protein EJB05_44952, partial [Eragrostis curvula]